MPRLARAEQRRAHGRVARTRDGGRWRAAAQPSLCPRPARQVVCDFCHAHLEVNKAAFESPRLELINDDARAQLEVRPRRRAGRLARARALRRAPRTEPTAQTRTKTRENPRWSTPNPPAPQNYPGKFDVIIGDLADPLEGGPCYQLYTQVGWVGGGSREGAEGCSGPLALQPRSHAATHARTRHQPTSLPSSDKVTTQRTNTPPHPTPRPQDFYQNVVMKKLNPGGIFITQSGPAGILSCTEVFTAINCTLRSVFPRVVPYTQHMPVYCDVWGWNLALTDPSQADIAPEEVDRRLAARVEGEMRFLDGATFTGLRALNKHLRGCLEGETCIYTQDTARFIHGSVAAGNRAAAAAVNGNGSS